MKNIVITIGTMLLIGTTQLSAQDGKNNTENKNDPTVLLEHKNGGKSAETNTSGRVPENKNESKAEKKVETPQKKEAIKYDKKPH